MELHNLGEHCSDESCRQLDFLPRKCDLCQKLFCQFHYSSMKHKCSSSSAAAAALPNHSEKRRQICDITEKSKLADRSKVMKQNNSSKCSSKGCKEKKLSAPFTTTCDDCTLIFCLAHRHPEDHNCDKSAVSTRPKLVNGQNNMIPTSCQSSSSNSGLLKYFSYSRSGQGSSSASRFVDKDPDVEVVASGKKRQYPTTKRGGRGGVTKKAKVAKTPAKMSGGGRGGGRGRGRGKSQKGLVRTCRSQQ